jgi:hypothetical protein
VLGWARRSDEVAQVVGEVDRMRARHMAGLFEQMGAAPAEAAMRAHMGYAGLRYVWLRRDRRWPKGWIFPPICTRG